MALEIGTLEKWVLEHDADLNVKFDRKRDMVLLDLKVNKKRHRKQIPAGEVTTDYIIETLDGMIAKDL